MTQTLDRYQRYHEQFKEFDSTRSHAVPGWLQAVRRKGMEDFSRLGFPTARRGNERWKYTNVAPIANGEFERVSERKEQVALDSLKRAAPWSDNWATVVFVDGVYSPELSNASLNGAVQVRSLAGLVRDDGAVIEPELASLAPTDDDGFTALNTAFIDDGALVHLADGAQIDAPLHLLFYSTDRDQPHVTYPRVLLVVGIGASATVIESYVGEGQNSYFTNGVAEIVVGEGARIDHYRLTDESDAAFHVGTVRVMQKDASSFRSRAFYRGVGLGRHDLQVTIDGSGCDCDLGGLYLTSGRQHVDNFINIDHVRPESRSRLLYKGILSGSSKAVFGGTVFVRKGAIKTDALQSDKNLVLSPDAEIDSKPALFIWADDVKCGHGATAGNIDKDTLFYMRSRGVDLEVASRLLIYGFASEIIDTVRVPELKSYLERLFLDAVPAHRFEFS